MDQSQDLRHQTPSRGICSCSVVHQGPPSLIGHCGIGSLGTTIDREPWFCLLFSGAVFFKLTIEHMRSKLGKLSDGFSEHVC